MNINLKSIADRAKHALYEEDAPVEQPQTPEPIIRKMPTLGPSSTTVTTGDPAFYGRLVDATDYTADQYVQQLLKGANRLESLIPDRSLRMKAVLAQTGISIDAIIAAVDAAIKALSGERAKFEESVNGSRQQLEKQKAEAADLEAKLFAMRESIQNAQGKLSSASSAFTGAEIRRKTELEAARAEFVALK